MVPFCGLGTTQSNEPVLGVEAAMVPQKGLRDQGWQGERRSREKPHEVLSQSWRVTFLKTGLDDQRMVKTLPGTKTSPRMGCMNCCVRAEVAFEVGSCAALL